MAQNENENDDYGDKPALCALFIFTLLVVIFNGYAIYAFIKNTIRLSRDLSGVAFDCFFYPKISVLAVLFFLGCVSLLLLFLTVSNFCDSDPEETTLGNLAVYSFYFLFGPFLSGVCFFFLLNMDKYGYTCSEDYKRSYNIPLHIVLTLFGAIGILIMVGPCVRKAIQKLSRSMSRREGCCAKFMNYFVKDKVNEEEEDIEYQISSQF